MKSLLVVHLKWVNFRVYKLYLSKAVFQKTYPESLLVGGGGGVSGGAMKIMTS